MTRKQQCRAGDGVWSHWRLLSKGSWWLRAEVCKRPPELPGDTMLSVDVRASGHSKQIRFHLNFPLHVFLKFICLRMFLRSKFPAALPFLVFPPALSWYNSPTFQKKKKKCLKVKILTHLNFTFFQICTKNFLPSSCLLPSSLLPSSFPLAFLSSFLHYLSWTCSCARHWENKNK